MCARHVLPHTGAPQLAWCALAAPWARLQLVRTPSAQQWAHPQAAPPLGPVPPNTPLCPRLCWRVPCSGLVGALAAPPPRPQPPGRHSMGGGRRWQRWGLGACAKPPCLLGALWPQQLPQRLGRGWAGLLGAGRPTHKILIFCGQGLEWARARWGGTGTRHGLGARPGLAGPHAPPHRFSGSLQPAWGWGHWRKAWQAPVNGNSWGCQWCPQAAWGGQQLQGGQQGWAAPRWAPLTAVCCRHHHCNTRHFARPRAAHGVWRCMLGGAGRRRPAPFRPLPPPGAAAGIMVLGWHHCGPPPPNQAMPIPFKLAD